MKIITKTSDNCPHCNPKSSALRNILIETKNFLVVCDTHPLTEGHILIIPKRHLSCVGVFPKKLFSELKLLYEKVINFLSNAYGKYAVFEHGIVGQTVFHCHVHFLPFNGNVYDIVPEKNKIKTISSLREIRNIYNKEVKYLFLQVQNSLYIINTDIGKPRFFRDRFANTLGVPERGDWKKSEEDKSLMKMFGIDVLKLKNKWKAFTT